MTNGEPVHLLRVDNFHNTNGRGTWSPAGRQAQASTAAPDPEIPPASQSHGPGDMRFGEAAKGRIQSATGLTPGSITNSFEAMRPIRSANSPRHIRATNTPMTLAQAGEFIAAHEAGLRRDRVHAHLLRVDSDRLVAGDREYRLGEGVRRLCTRLHAPADYVAGLPATLRDRVLQYHLESGNLGRSSAPGDFWLFSRDGVFLDLVPAHLHSLDGGAVLQAVRAGVGDDAAALEVQNLTIDDEAFRIDLVSPRIANEVRPGDVIGGGVQVEHSLVGDRAPVVMAYVVRLVCSNGLVRRECLGRKGEQGGSRCTPRTRRLGSDRADAHQLQVEQVRRLVAETWEGLLAKMEAICRLRDERVDNPEKQLEQFLRQGRLASRGLMAVLRQAWTEEGQEPTAFGLLNALTRAATHPITVRQGARDITLTPRQRRLLARLAGLFAYRHVHLCPHCFSVLHT